jgi:hypothetical protein
MPRYHLECSSIHRLVFSSTKYRYFVLVFFIKRRILTDRGTKSIGHRLLERSHNSM